MASFPPVLWANEALKRVPVPLLAFVGVLPALWLIFQVLTGGLGADPLKALEHGFGLHALQFLLATLAVTPARRFLGLNLMRFRRSLGLLCFFYAFAHLLIWLMLDMQLRWPEILRDVTRRPYIVIGLVAFLLLLPLAVTSSDVLIKRLGAPAWRRLHLLVWPAACLAAFHFLMVGKVWEREALIYGGLFLLLLVSRITWRPRQS